MRLNNIDIDNVARNGGPHQTYFKNSVTLLALQKNILGAILVVLSCAEAK